MGWDKTVSTQMNQNGHQVTDPGALFGQAFVELLRQVIRDEMQTASNGNGHALLTAEQLAEKLQVHPATVYQWVKSKTIPYYKAGRFVRFNLQEVLESQRKRNESTS